MLLPPEVVPTAPAGDALVNVRDDPYSSNGSPAADTQQDGVNGKTVAISCENIHKTYLLGVEGVPALRGISLDVHQGEFLLIYGTSGGGKSTLLNVLGTIDVPTKGNLELFGKRVTDRTPDSMLALLRLRRIGFVFQSFNLLSTMTAEENVALPMILAGDLSSAEITARARSLLTDVGLGHRFGHYPSMLSGGEQQRVTIARALANRPDLLLLDEPTGDLDTRNTHLVMQILLSLNEKSRLTMAMVTHDVYMKQYAHRIVLLRDGKVHSIKENSAQFRETAIAELNNTVAKEAVELAQARERPAQVEIRRAQDYPFFAATRPANKDAALCGSNPVQSKALLKKLFGIDTNRAQPSQPPRSPASHREDNEMLQVPTVSTFPPPREQLAVDTIKTM